MQNLTTPTHAESLVQSLKKAESCIGFNVNSDKTEVLSKFMPSSH